MSDLITTCLTVAAVVVGFVCMMFFYALVLAFYAAILALPVLGVIWLGQQVFA